MTNTTEPNRDAQAKSTKHKVFLLKLWRDSAEVEWRLAIQQPNHGEQRGLPSLTDLTAYLEQAMLE